MIALATPFGKYIANAVKETTQSLFGVSNNALKTGLGAADPSYSQPSLPPIDFSTIS